MDEIKCTRCTMMIPADATICPCCGGKKNAFKTPRISNVTIFFIIAGSLIVLSVFNVLNFTKKNPEQSSNIEITKKNTIKRSNVNHTIEPRRVVTKPITDDLPPTLEFKLATINAGRYVTEDDITVARFRSLLGQLSSIYIENNTQIADMSVRAQELLKKDGIKENLLNIMEGMNQIMPRKIENKKYSEYVAAYVTLRHKGQSHADTVLALQTFSRQIRR